MRTRTDIAAAYTGASGAAYDRMPAIAGVGCTPFYRRGGTVGRTAVELACAAILDSLCDAGYHHLCLHVSSVDETVAELRRRGVIIVREPFTLESISRRLAFFADQWGNLIELSEAL